MKRSYVGALTCFVASFLAGSPSARADISPPNQSITVELTVAGLDSVPELSFFVTNCREVLEESVLEKGKTLVCPPHKGPLRVYGFRKRDLIEMFAMIRRDAGGAESAKFLRDKAKTCGEIEGVNPIIPGGGRWHFTAHYAMERVLRRTVASFGASRSTRSRKHGRRRRRARARAPKFRHPLLRRVLRAPTSADRSSSCGCRAISTTDSTRGYGFSFVLLGVFAVRRMRRLRGQGHAEVLRSPGC